MKKIKCFSFTLTLICLLFTLARAQASKESNRPETTTCPAAQTFTIGSGGQKFAFCITVHGNIRNLESPANFQHINAQEGYAVCSSVGAGPSGSHGYDAGSHEEGWGAASASQPGGANTFPLSITRSSTDGKFELKQTFDWDTAQKEITVTMVLKNISNAAITNIRVTRYFDADLSGDSDDDYFDGGEGAAWGRDADVPKYGLMLSAISTAYPYRGDIEHYSDWTPAGGTGAATARHCYGSIVFGPPPPQGDYVGRLTYTLGTISAGQSKTVKMLYKRF